MPEWPWVVASYGLTWLVLGAYTLMVRRRLRRARTELEGAAVRRGPATK